MLSGKQLFVRPAVTGMLMLAVSSAAFGYSISTPPSFINSVGQPVAAHADFEFRNGGLVVTVQNQTADLRYFTQSLAGIKFTLKNFSGSASLQNSRGNVTLLGQNGMPGNPSAESTNWTFELKDGQFTLNAPGKLYTVLPDSGSQGFANADSSLTGADQSPFMTGPVSFFIALPNFDSAQSGDIEGVEFIFGDQAPDTGNLNGGLNNPIVNNGVPDPTFDPGNTNFGGTPQLGSGTGTPSGQGTGSGGYQAPYLPPMGENPNTGGTTYGLGGDTPSYNDNNNGNSFSPYNFANAPEPATAMILAGAGLGLLLKRRKH